MIDYVRGEVQRVAEGVLVLDVGGVGMRLEATPSAVAELSLGEIVQVATTLIVREDSWTLYGFVDSDERDVFEQVQTVSGVGPRIAQALVAGLGADGVRRAVTGQDPAALMRVPGIGRKGAQRILLELSDKLGPPVPAATGTPGPAQPAAAGAALRDRVMEGLTSLGWTTREAESALTHVQESEPDLMDTADVASVLRAALRELKRP